MKVKKQYKISNGNQIWRILITEFNKLIVETRNTVNKEVFFSAKDLTSGKTIFENFQFEEKFWIGIEKIYKDVIFLHKFPKPDMPGHREIIAFDINTSETIWEKPELVFQFALDDKIYAFTESLEGRQNYVLDYLTGEVEDKIDEEEFGLKFIQSQSQEDYSNYIFPERLTTAHPEYENFKKIVNTNLKAELKGEIEFAVFDKSLITSVHEKLKNDKMKSTLFVNDISSGKLVFEKTSNASIDLFASDLFFIYNNLLFLIVEKNELFVYKLADN